MSEAEAKMEVKVKKLTAVRNLVKQLVAKIPDYQIRLWCKANEKELAGDIICDWMSHKDTLPEPEKALVLECWSDVLSMTARDVASLVKNYGK
jgi:hypothetical protein